MLSGHYLVQEEVDGIAHRGDSITLEGSVGGRGAETGLFDEVFQGSGDAGWRVVRYIGDAVFKVWLNRAHGCSKNMGAGGEILDNFKGENIPGSSAGFVRVDADAGRAHELDQIGSANEAMKANGRTVRSQGPGGSSFRSFASNVQLPARQVEIFPGVDESKQAILFVVRSGEQHPRFFRGNVLRGCGENIRSGDSANQEFGDAGC